MAGGRSTLYFYFKSSISFPFHSTEMCTWSNRSVFCCPQASSFWNKFQSWYSTVSKASLLLSEPEVLFGITRPCAHRLTLNHLIILGKYFLYINALNNIRFVFSDFISFVQDKIKIEKYIAAMLNGENFHRNGNSFIPVKAFP